MENNMDMLVTYMQHYITLFARRRLHVRVLLSKHSTTAFDPLLEHHSAKHR